MISKRLEAGVYPIYRSSSLSAQHAAKYLVWVLANMCAHVVGRAQSIGGSKGQAASSLFPVWACSLPPGTICPYSVDGLVSPMLAAWTWIPTSVTTQPAVCVGFDNESLLKLVGPLHDIVLVVCNNKVGSSDLLMGDVFTSRCCKKARRCLDMIMWSVGQAFMWDWWKISCGGGKCTLVCESKKNSYWGTCFRI